MTLIHVESHRIFTRPLPPNGVFLRFTIESPLSVASLIFALDSPKILRKVNKISICSEKLPHMLFFCFKENVLFGDSSILETASHTKAAFI